MLSFSKYVTENGALLPYLGSCSTIGNPTLTNFTSLVSDDLLRSNNTYLTDENLIASNYSIPFAMSNVLTGLFP